MNNYVHKKAFWQKFTIEMLDLKKSELARELEITPSSLSKYLAGERENPKLFELLINKLEKHKW